MYIHYNYVKGENMLVLDMEDLKNIALAFKAVFTPECDGLYKRIITTDEHQQFIKHIIDHTTFDKDEEGRNWGYILSTHIIVDGDGSRNNLSFFSQISLRYNKCIFRNIYINEIDTNTIDLDDEVAIITGSSFHDCYFDHVIFDSCRLRSLGFFDTFFRNVSFLQTILRDCIIIDCAFEGYLFHDCNIIDCSDLSFIPLACPSDGGFIGWKKALRNIDYSIHPDDEGYHVLIKLYIPADAKRSSATGNKCRCSKAKVLDITSLDEKEHFDEAYSIYVHDFKYKVGEYVEPRGTFNEDRFDKCSAGIHFFINKQDAIDY